MNLGGPVVPALDFLLDVNPRSIERAESWKKSTSPKSIHVIEITETTDVVQDVREINRGGVDIVFEMSGAPSAVNQALGMARNGGHVSPPTADGPIGCVEGRQHGKRKRALHVEIDTSAMMLPRIERLGPLIQRPHAKLFIVGQWWNDWLAAELQVDGSGCCQNCISHRFRLETAPVHSP